MTGPAGPDQNYPQGGAPQGQPGWNADAQPGYPPPGYGQAPGYGQGPGYPPPGYGSGYGYGYRSVGPSCGQLLACNCCANLACNACCCGQSCANG
jgi:hypothetical protein